MQALHVQQLQQILTPKLIQTATILQLSSTELEEYINNEIISNPLLEINEEVEKERIYEVISYRYPKYIKPDEGEKFDYEDYAKAQWSLSDFLHMQLALVPHLDKKTRTIGEYIIDTLDHNGYRTERASIIAEKLGYTHDEVMKAVNIIQELEPAGVSAKSLEECLILQLKRSGEYDKTFEKIINNHLNDVAANRIALIAKSCKISIDKAQDYCDIIRGFDPKPGSRYGKDPENRYIIPDCILTIDNSEFAVSFNDSLNSCLQISPYYDRLKLEAKDSKETLDYLEERMQSALNLIKDLEQRKNTISNIANIIVNYQKDFFLRSQSLLKPMTLSDIAKLANVHESTVSRTVNGKYIQTPKGMFELKYFFGGGTLSLNGSRVSSNTIQNYLKQIISSEDSSHPFSDEELRMELSRQRGIVIARRTVSKYREELGIQSSSERVRKSL